jgi:hypothetical protein
MEHKFIFSKRITVTKIGKSGVPAKKSRWQKRLRWITGSKKYGEV